MGAAHWWERRRYGIYFQASLASVPAWAPVGQFAEWYRAHLDSGVCDVFLHPSPMAETLAHHRDNWAHIEEYDDFFPFLHFDRFDADEWAEIVTQAGAGSAVFTAKHHDGLCWWDAPNTDRTVLHDGPARNVLAELAAACARADIAFGTYYSLLDWGDPRYPTERYVDEVAHPHVVDLVERYGSRILWGDGHWGGGESRWHSDDLIDRVRRVDPDIVVNDRWWCDGPTVRSFDDQMPNGILDEPWELRRGLGASLGPNRAERSEQLLTAAGIVALLTEVVAKNGHLLLAVGPDASGRIPDRLTEPLVAAGAWLRDHGDIVHRGQPWTTWGDARCRYVEVDGHLHAIDVAGDGVFNDLPPSQGRVTRVTVLSRDDERPVDFDQTDHGLDVRRRRAGGDQMAAVYRIDLEPRPDPPIELFASTDNPPKELAQLLADAEPGSIVRLGDGVHIGPARIPADVTLRGLGPDRTIIDGLESCAVTLSKGARVEHCRILGGGSRAAWLPTIAACLAGPGAVLLGCRIEGHVRIDADDSRVTSCSASGVVADTSNNVAIARSTFAGHQWDCGVDITGGYGHTVDGCEFSDLLIAVRFRDTVGSSIDRNRIRGRWWGIQLIDADDTEVVGNAIDHTLRAVDVDGGRLSEVSGNSVTNGDSGCIVQRGASATTVAGNRWERCRVGLLVWDAVDIRHYDNDCADLTDLGAEVVIGP